MKPILLHAKITKATRKKDGNISLALQTVSEITPEELAGIDRSLEVAGYFSFTPNPASPANIPKEVVEDGSKSSGERLRAVLFVYYNQHEKRHTMSFDEFYKQIMEVFITNIKDRLPPRDPMF